MAITAAERNQIIELTVLMFNAAPGAEYLAQIVALYEATPGTADQKLQALAGQLAQTAVYRSMHPNFETAEEFAASFLTPLGLQNDDVAKDFIIGGVNAGMPKGQIVYEAYVALNMVPSTANNQYSTANAILNNKTTVAEYYSVTAAGAATDLSTLQNVVALVTSTQESVDAAISVIAGTAGGQTFMLTKALDNIQGTAGNDTIIGSISTGGTDLDTLSTLDIVNGGAGTDTLKIASSVAGIVLPNMTNVEVVEIEGTAGVTVDATTVTGVTDLNVVKHGSAAVNATASATTNVSVAVKENGAGSALSHTVNGGNNVKVTAADAGATSNADTITIGGTTAPKGDVVVNVTGKAYDAAVADVLLGDITTTGGKTVSVTQKASSDASKAASDTSANKVVQGAVTVNANADTTTITVKQDATVAAKNAANTTGGVTETVTVKFGALKNGDVLAANGLTLTAKADMTAAEVAAAFANLVSGLANANTDTQGSGLASKVTYTGAFATGANTAAGYTAAAANGDTVVFTAARANQDATDLAFTLTNTSGNSTAPTVTIVQGKAHDATPAGGVMGVDAGAVVIAGGAAATAVKTITVDGYAATGSAITGTTSALETLNLSNGGNFTVAQAAATLTLNLAKVGTAAKTETLTSAAAAEVRAVLDLNNTATKTLNVRSEGTNTVSLDLAGATGTTALNVSGTGTLDARTASNLGAVTTIKVTEAAGLNLGSTATTNVTSVDTTGTTGATTVAISGTAATYTGGAGKDSVTITNAGTAITKAIDLGAGDDTLTLSGDVAVPTVDLKGGEGTDTLAMSAASAVSLSANGTFAGKIDGFEKLSITKATAAGTVNLANMDNISYVVSANSDSVSSAATKTTFTLDVAGSTATAGDTVGFDGSVYAFTGAAATDAAFATQLYALISATPPAGGTWVATGVSGSKITFEAVAAGVLATPAAGDFVFTDEGSGDTETFATAQVTAGAAAGAAAAALTIDKMASGGTLELTAAGAGAVVKVTDAGKGEADVLNVVTNVNGNVGTVTAADVETINLNIKDQDTSITTRDWNGADGNPVKVENVSTTTLAVAGNTATKAITVEGAGHLSLTVSANTKLASVDASKATGALTLNLAAHNGDAITVTGGSGRDVLTASQGATGKADVLVGGAGNDTLYAGSNGAKLTGGAGDDLFVLKAANKEANTHSSILDFQAGDVLKLEQSGAATAITAFAKLGATLGTNAVFSDYVNAAIAQAGANGAVWFQFGSNGYVVIDQGANTAAFVNDEDSIIELVGIDLANASFNSTHGTIALV